jgi:hypothetical protein
MAPCYTETTEEGNIFSRRTERTWRLKRWMMMMNNLMTTMTATCVNFIHYSRIIRKSCMTVFPERVLCRFPHSRVSQYECHADREEQPVNISDLKLGQSRNEVQQNGMNLRSWQRSPQFKWRWAARFALRIFQFYLSFYCLNTIWVLCLARESKPSAVLQYVTEFAIRKRGKSCGSDSSLL